MSSISFCNCAHFSINISASPPPEVPLMGTNEDDPSFLCHSQSPPTLEDLKGSAELPVQNKESADYTMPKQNEDAQTGADDCNIEKTGNDLSNPASELMNEYMLVDDFIFSDKSLVGRFTLMNPSLEELLQWSGKQWKPKLSTIWMFKIMAEGFFKIEFFSEDDCEFVLENGPWFMGLAGLALRRWSPDFDPKSPGQLKTPIWMRLLNLPLEFGGEGALINICSVIGKVFKISEPLKKGLNGSLTRRVCVEVDLSKELKSAIILKAGNYSHKQQLDYEGIPFRCKVCHSREHLEGSCPKGSRKNMRNKNGLISTTSQNMNIS